MVRETISLGPATTDGFEATVVRAYDMDESDYYHNFVDYELTGVESISMDPPEVVGATWDKLVHVEFVNGKSTYVLGVITEVE